MKKIILLSVLLTGLVGCATYTNRITESDLNNWYSRYLNQAFKDQEPIVGSVTLSEAIARALKYNLEKKVSLLEEELARSQANVSVYDLFPSIVVGGRLVGRNNPPMSDSKDLETGDITPAENYSSTVYPYKFDVDVQGAWNIVDFGVKMVRHLQAVDRAFISSERRRKAVQEIISEVQIAFWRAAAAQRLATDVERLLPRVDEALKLRRREEVSGSKAPIDSLAEQRTLLELKRQLLSIHNTLVNSKITLASLMGLPPNSDFRVNYAAEAGVPNLNISVESLEQIGLRTRPELFEEAYAERIAKNDVVAAGLSVLPSISGEGGYNYTTDALVVNKTWINYGVQLSYNIINLARAIHSITNNQKRIQLVRQRRLAVAMSVITQIRLSWLNYWQTREQYQAAVDFANVEDRMLQRIQDLARVGSVGELELIRAYMNGVISQLNKDLAYADMRAALNRVQISVGLDPVPDALSSTDVIDVALDIKRKSMALKQTLLAKAHLSESELFSKNLRHLKDKEIEQIFSKENGYEWQMSDNPSSFRAVDNRFPLLF